MSLDPSLRRIFNEALDREDAAERSHYLDQACREDPALRTRLEKLLRAHASAGNFLAQPEAEAGAMRWPENHGLSFEQPGSRVGRYKLLEQIGEGGCGIVYMAEQEEPVRRRVALKIIKLGMDTRAVIARFEAERQALAIMDHPNIAKVYDAAATETGRPYFVMELVRGVKITEYCDQQSLTTEERLQLFVQVCKAVQHAHQKGIIHRDLKPANILVTLHDGAPVPKVIDFGIAKATGQERLTEKTLFTSFEQFIGTPAYMSPEQAERSGLDIDTRTDVYSLGVVLYELLTGKTPLDSKDILGAGIEGMRRTIREKEPAVPSTRLHTILARELVTVARQRQTAPPRLIKQLRGDLDWVVMKCLEKDRTRRYATAIEPALDLERHLRHEPVTARPVSRIYQFRKLVYRHKAAFAAGAGIAAALLVGISLSTRLYFRERAALKLAGENARSAASQAKAAQSSAEREAQERLRAEQAVTRLELESAELLLAQNDSSRALALLARLLRRQPAHQVAAERIFSALTQRNFCLLAGPPLRHGPPVQPGRPFDPKAVTHPALTASSICSIQFSPDGERVLTASRDGTAVLWDVRTGQPAVAPFQHGDEVLHAAFSPDGTRIVTAGREGRAFLWSVEGRLLAVLPHDGPVLYAEFTAQGDRMATASGDGAARIWSVASGQLLAGPLRHSNIVVTARFSRDGESLLTASLDHTARVWNARNGAPRSPPLRQINEIITADLNPDGDKVTAGAYNWTISIWHAATGHPIVNSISHQEIVYVTRFTPDSKLVLSGGGDGKVRFWDVPGAVLLPRFIKHDGVINALAISADRRSVATASSDTTARLWDIKTALPLTEPINHDSPVVLAALSQDGRHFATASQKGETFVWAVPRPNVCRTELEHQIRPLQSGRYSPDGKTIATFEAGTHLTVRLWDVATASLKSIRHPHVRIINAVEFSPDNRLLATASLDQSAAIWDIEARKTRFVFQHRNTITAVRFSPNGQMFLTVAADGTAKLWDIHSGELIVQVEHGRYSGATADFAPDGEHFVTASRAGTAQIWKTGTGQPDGPPLRHEEDVLFVQYSRDGRKIVTTSVDKSARIWDASSGERLGPPLRHDESVIAASFSPDGLLLVTCSGTSARLWDVEGGRPATRLLRHGAKVNSASFSADGRYVVTSSDDGTARIWEAATGQPVSEPFRHSDAVVAAEFSPDGRSLLTVGKDGSAAIWALPEPGGFNTSMLADLAEALAGQRLNASGEFEHITPSALWLVQKQVPRGASNLGPVEQWIAQSSNSGPPEIAGRRAGDQWSDCDPVDDYVRSLRYGKAMEEHSGGNGPAPSPVLDYIYGAYGYIELREYGAAAAELRRAVALRPNDSFPYNELAWVLCEGLHNCEEALPHALEAVRLAPAHPNHWSTLGNIYYRLGRYQASLNAFEEVLRICRPRLALAEDYFFLAMNQHRLGDLTAAQESYRLGVERLPKGTEPMPEVVIEWYNRLRSEAAALLGEEAVAK